MQDWFEESEAVGRRIVESDDRVASKCLAQLRGHDMGHRGG